MDKFKLEYIPFGRSALLVNWPRMVDESILNDIIRFRASIRKAMPELETVPAYNSLTLISRAELDHQRLTARLKKLYLKASKGGVVPHTLWELPVCYEEGFALDLGELSREKSLSPEEIVKLHTEPLYTIYAIGFLPGFMYLGGLPKVLHHPRRKEPRLNIPKGAVGIGGEQTGVYPQESPGGWNIIGNCPIQLFHPGRKDPLDIRVGDKVRFFPIDSATHALYTIQSETGIYHLKHEVYD